MIVLIAEDDPDVLAVIRLALESHDLILAENGREAVEALEAERRIDIAILDVMMPEIDGLTVLRVIRKHGVHREAPVIMLTARSSESDHLEAFRRGADAYMTKPFVLDELRDAIEELAAKSWEARTAQREKEIERAELLRKLERRF